MKKIIAFAAAALTLASCDNTPKTMTYDEVQNLLSEKILGLQGDSTITEAQIEERFFNIIEEVYQCHYNDTVDVELFTTLMTNKWDYQTTKAEFEKASEMIKTNEKIQTKLEAVANKDLTEVGKPYVDIEGEDALTGETFKLSDMLSDKPLLVDFWASWCAPCRREIQGHLLNVAAEGKVNVVGIAVWEESKDDTLKAMEELGITWKVMYTGGRENSPSVTYGVFGIPTLVLIDTDGTIIGRGHSIEEIPFFNE